MVYEFYRALGIPKDATDEDIKKALANPFVFISYFYNPVRFHRVSSCVQLFYNRYKHLALFYNPKRHSRRPKTPDDPLMSKSEKATKEYAEEMHRNNMYLAISEAFDVLTDPQKRAIYDQFGEQALKEGLVGPNGFIAPYVYHGDPDLTFKEFFGTDNPFAELIMAACAPMDAFVSKETQGFRPKASPVFRNLPVTYEDVYNGAVRKIMIPKKFLCGDGLTMETRDHVMTVEVPAGATEGMEFNFPNEGDQLPNMQPGSL